MPVTKRQIERLTGLVLAGFIAVNYPLLSLFSRAALWLGIPLLYLYLFVFWALFIGLAAVIMEKRGSPGPAPHRPEQKDTG
jgi:hypothetical protein